MVQLSLDGLRRDAVLFGESQSRILLSVKPDQEKRVLTLVKEAAVPAARIGTVGGNRLVVQVDGDQRNAGCTLDLDLKTLHEQWTQAIPRALGQD
jgi:phosphoribosylformylglycinamidine synthase